VDRYRPKVGGPARNRPDASPLCLLRLLCLSGCQSLWGLSNGDSVVPPGIEPGSNAPEAFVVSILLRDLVWENPNRAAKIRAYLTLFMLEQRIWNRMARRSSPPRREALLSIVKVKPRGVEALLAIQTWI
jgi:hypothetical protein